MPTRGNQDDLPIDEYLCLAPYTASRTATGVCRELLEDLGLLLTAAQATRGDRSRQPRLGLDDQAADDLRNALRQLTTAVNDSALGTDV
ncbi:MAG TPA: hypothetical protein VNT03_00250 [Baekduia sp.]|nr:hypothetical protein [Baekduia sp.]